MADEPGRLRRRHLQRQLEIRGDDSAEDVQPDPAARGTLMSHFLPPGTVLALAAGVIEGAAGACLVASSGFADGVSARQ